MAEANTIIRCTVGSTVHGLALEGTDDRDEMGVCIEEFQSFAGFTEFEQYIYRSAAEREGKHDAKSQPGDLDLCIYGLKKFLRLAMQGNPSVINLLFVPTQFCQVMTWAGLELQQQAPLIVSKQAGKRFLGYMEAQKQRLMGERGQKRTNRPELEEKYGYDTKYACHVVRLGYEGVEVMQTGRITLPMPEPSLTFCRDIRLGKVPLQDVLQKAGELERELKDLLDVSELPESPNRAVLESWMLDLYKRAWGG
jgi:predicted nucleotidyltransferase